MNYEIFESIIKDTLNKNKKYEKIDILIELLYENNYMDYEIHEYDNNKIFISSDEYEIDDYDIDELINNKFDYEIYDKTPKEYIIKIDNYEFRLKDEITSIYDLNKFNIEYNLFNKLIDDDDTIKYIKDNYMGMDLLNNYLIKKIWIFNNFLSFELDEDDEDNELLYYLRRLLNDEFIDDIEVYEDIYEFLDEYNYNDRRFNEYNVNIYNKYNILINHDTKWICNIKNIYDFMRENIYKYFHDENNEKIIYYDELIELYNICTNNKYKHIINYDNLFDYLDFDEIINYMINKTSIDYDYYGFDEFIELNNLFYETYKKYHLKINKEIYENIKKIREIELNRNI